MDWICGTVYAPSSGGIAFVSGIALDNSWDIVALEIAGQKSGVRDIVRAARAGQCIESSDELVETIGRCSLRFLKGGIRVVTRTLPGGLTHATVTSVLCQYTRAFPIPREARRSYIIQPASMPSLDPSRLALRIRLQLNLPILPEVEAELADVAQRMDLVEMLTSAGTIRGWELRTDNCRLWEQCLVEATRRAAR